MSDGSDRYRPLDGDRCRWGVEWTWRADVGLWTHSSGSTMTHEQARERGAGFVRRACKWPGQTPGVHDHKPYDECYDECPVHATVPYGGTAVAVATKETCSMPSDREQSADAERGSGRFVHLGSDVLVAAKHREHRTYDTQQTHSTDTDGTRFVCGWCGGWGHKAAADGRPVECYECNALGWYLYG